jgi:hypothetical protein
MWPFRRKKPHQILEEKVNREIQAALPAAEFAIAEDDGLRQARYTRNGTLDYEAYRTAQNIGNRVKLQHVYTKPDVIDAIARHARDNAAAVTGILCHGTRNGAEIAWFAERFPKAAALGTDIADSATMFQNTIQWDFHDMRDDWRGRWSIVYSNSWDHAMEPRRAFRAWSDSLAAGGILYLEHGPGHQKVDRLDMFGATRKALASVVAESTGGQLEALPWFDVFVGKANRTVMPFRKLAPAVTSAVGEAGYYPVPAA